MSFKPNSEPAYAIFEDLASLDKAHLCIKAPFLPSYSPWSGYCVPLTRPLNLLTSTFTVADREEIERWASRPIFRAWTQDMVAGVRIIPKDTITAIFSSKHLDGWAYFYLHYGQGFHSFGCPLFLRNYTWCLFYSGHHCGWLCGDGQLALYKKEGGRWVFVKNWGVWMS
jgi:hypothetical protein